MTRESQEPLPPYSYVPGGPWPHPTRSPQGHSFGRPMRGLEPSGGTIGSDSPEFLRGIALFDAGYYWEAHEAWEGLWHAAGRRGATADVLKGLIKLAAAGVKVRERQVHGIRTHALRAAASFAAARADGGAHQLGLDLDQCIQWSHAIAENPPEDPGPSDASVTRVFPFRIGDSGGHLDGVDER